MDYPGERLLLKMCVWGKLKGLARPKGLDLSIDVIEKAATRVVSNAF
tara:strand:- start:13200 stop:13340 length:141 start_codon:yes stop_codon:yes gene_type:complete